ncbi:hypothetical protein B0H14DRAFT_3446140 [Mycena olivaceomarginata]|nr:hypothetical protein B0H14DRAFT_3446140 [Mycena olivaceomarginata]
MSPTGLGCTSVKGRRPRGYLFGFTMRLVGCSPLPPPPPLAAPTCSQPRRDRTPSVVFRFLTDSASPNPTCAGSTLNNVASTQMSKEEMRARALGSRALGGMHSLPEGGYLLLGSLDELLCRLPTLLFTWLLQRRFLRKGTKEPAISFAGQWLGERIALSAPEYRSVDAELTWRRSVFTLTSTMPCDQKLTTATPYQFSRVEVRLVLPSPQHGVWWCEVTLTDDVRTRRGGAPGTRMGTRCKRTAYLGGFNNAYRLASALFWLPLARAVRFQGELRRLGDNARAWSSGSQAHAVLPLVLHARHYPDNSALLLGAEALPCNVTAHVLPRRAGFRKQRAGLPPYSCPLYSFSSLVIVRSSGVFQELRRPSVQAASSSGWSHPVLHEASLTHGSESARRAGTTLQAGATRNRLQTWCSQNHRAPSGLHTYGSAAGRAAFVYIPPSSALSAAAPRTSVSPCRKPHCCAGPVPKPSKEVGGVASQNPPPCGPAPPPLSTPTEHLRYVLALAHRAQCSPWSPQASWSSTIREIANDGGWQRWLESTHTTGPRAPGLRSALAQVRVRASFPASRPRVLTPRRASATAARGYHYVEPLLWVRAHCCPAVAHDGAGDSRAGGSLTTIRSASGSGGGKTPLHELGPVWRLFSTPCAPRRRANHLALLLGPARYPRHPSCTDATVRSEYIGQVPTACIREMSAPYWRLFLHALRFLSMHRITRRYTSESLGHDSLRSLISFSWQRSRTTRLLHMDAANTMSAFKRLLWSPFIQPQVLPLPADASVHADIAMLRGYALTNGGTRPRSCFPWVERYAPLLARHDLVAAIHTAQRQGQRLASPHAHSALVPALAPDPVERAYAPRHALLPRPALAAVAHQGVETRVRGAPSSLRPLSSQSLRSTASDTRPRVAAALIPASLRRKRASSFGCPLPAPFESEEDYVVWGIARAFGPSGGRYTLLLARHDVVEAPHTAQQRLSARAALASRLCAFTARSPAACC